MYAIRSLTGLGPSASAHKRAAMLPLNASDDNLAGLGDAVGPAAGAGLKGVSWDAQQQSFDVRIYWAGKQRLVGRYPDAVAAGMAYDKAAVYLFGEQADTNFGVEAAMAAPGEVSKSIMKVKRAVGKQTAVNRLGSWPGRPHCRTHCAGTSSPTAASAGRGAAANGQSRQSPWRQQPQQQQQQQECWAPRSAPMLSQGLHLLPYEQQPWAQHGQSQQQQAHLATSDGGSSDGNGGRTTVAVITMQPADGRSSSVQCLQDAPGAGASIVLPVACPLQQQQLQPLPLLPPLLLQQRFLPLGDAAAATAGMPVAATATSLGAPAWQPAPTPTSFAAATFPAAHTITQGVHSQLPLLPAATLLLAESSAPPAAFTAAAPAPAAAPSLPLVLPSVAAAVQPLVVGCSGLLLQGTAGSGSLALEGLRLGSPVIVPVQQPQPALQLSLWQ